MVYIEKYNLIAPLGNSISECFDAMEKGLSGIKYYAHSRVSDSPISAALFPHDFFDAVLDDSYSRLEKLGVMAIHETLCDSDIKLDDKETLLIVSTTKGNVEYLEKINEGQVASTDSLELWKSADKIASYFKMNHKPMVVSNACVSGLAALILGQRLIDMRQYKRVVVLGIDVLSKFIVSGFQSFKALSENRCMPFDQERKGLNLGEGAGVIILSNHKPTGDRVEIAGGSTSNDANHISGPSRTGEGLLIAIKKALGTNQQVDFISAHGTATRYNDDMESKAIFRAGLDRVPTNSYKGYFGHTLGAAGVLEAVVSLECMSRGVLLPTLGLHERGTAEEINVLKEKRVTTVNNVLKLTSGFGGCNAVVYLRKISNETD